MKLNYKPFYSTADPRKENKEIENALGVYIYLGNGKEISITENSNNELIINCEHIIVKPNAQNQIIIK